MSPERDVELLEREDELAVLDALLDQAASGRGGVVLVEGPAGIGKTTVLQALKRGAPGRGVRVLSARGSELERDFPFGVVRQLFEPLIAGADPVTRRSLLEHAAEPAATVLGVRSARRAGDDTFSMLHALYWLCANASESGPLLVAVDDAQWSDPPSLRFLAFLLSRLEDVPVAVVMTVRTDEARAEPLLMIGSDPLTRVVGLAPLSKDGVATLVRARMTGPADDDFSAACFEATGGNPFLMRELLGELVFQHTSSTALGADQVRGLAPGTVSRAVFLRLSRLGEPAMALARAVAVLGDGAELRVAAALADLPQTDAARAADELARAHILAPGRPLAYLHPVIRTAVYSDLAAGERAIAHERAARLLASEGADLEGVAAHLLVTDPGSDAWTVETLCSVARDAAARGAPDVAAVHLRRAVAESTTLPTRWRTELDLAIAEYNMGSASAADTFREVWPLVPDVRVRARNVGEFAGALLSQFRVDEATTVLESTWNDVAPVDRDHAFLVDAQLINHGTLWGGIDVARERVRRYTDPPAGGTEYERQLLAALSIWRSWSGSGYEEAAAMAERALRGSDDLRSSAYTLAIYVLIVADRVDAARTALERLLSGIRKIGWMTGFVGASVLRSALALRTGAVADAEVDARTAVELVRVHHWLGETAPAAWLALVDALVERDELAEAEDALRASGLDGAIPDTLVMAALLLYSRGMLRLAEGRVDLALTDLLTVERRQREWDTPTPSGTPAGARAAPFLAARGDVDEARRMATDGVRTAKAWGTPRGIGIALRGLAHVEGGDAGIGLMREAVAVLETSPARLELGHALVDLGAMLRRAQRRSEARDPLRAALEIGRRCSSVRLARLAHAELEATGERVARPAVTGPESLTPSERRITRMAADGMSNRDIAQTLFLTVKTVEAHLTRAYRKLDISSRDELARLKDALGG